MSEIYSFRLDKDNPRENCALNVILQWKLKGFSIRYILTEALIEFKARAENTKKSKTSDALAEVLKQLNQLNEQLIRNSGLLIDDNASRTELAASFVTSIKREVKPGMRKDK
jgi:hypothetical protein